MTCMNVDGTPAVAGTRGTEDGDGVVRIPHVRGFSNMKQDGDLPYLLDILDEAPQNNHGLPVLRAKLKPRTCQPRAVVAEGQHRIQIHDLLDSLDGGDGDDFEYEPARPLPPVAASSRFHSPPNPPPLLTSPPRITLHMRPFSSRQDTHDLVFHSGMTLPAMALTDLMDSVMATEARRSTTNITPPVERPSSSSAVTIPSSLYLPSQLL